MKATLSLRRAAALDWGKVKAVLAPQDFAVVSAQRARHQELSRVLATPLPKVDLEQYKQVLANQEVVAQVEQALAGYKPVTGDVSPVLRSLDEQQAKAVEQAKETVAAVKETVSTFQQDLAGIKNLAHYYDLAPEAVYEAAPGLEKVYHDRLRKGKVYHDDHNFGEKFFG